MQLLISRHAETTWNLERRIQGWTDSPLTQHGTLQARSLANRLRTTKIHAIYCSDLTRAVRTAECIGLWHDIEVVPHPNLRESSWGEWEGLTAEEISDRSPDLWAKFVKRGQDSGEGDADWESSTLVPGGESAHCAAERVGIAVEEIKAKHAGSDDRVLVVGHGGSLRFALTHVLGVRPSLARRFHLDNCSLSEIWFAHNHPPAIHLLNDISHIMSMNSP